MSKLSNAVCNVMTEIRRLSKEDRNKHGSYDFTSVDDFKDAIRPLMAKHGLSLHVSQTAFQMIEYISGKGDKKSVAQFDMAITLHHKSGKKAKPENMTVALPFTGAQTSGAARSYAVKEWMKSRFLVSSGDAQDEADLLEQSREGLRLSKQEARPLTSDLNEELRKLVEGRDRVALETWWNENKHRTETLPKDWYIMLRTDYATAWKELKAQEDLDKMTNGELDAMAEKQSEVA